MEPTKEERAEIHNKDYKIDTYKDGLRVTQTLRLAWLQGTLFQVTPGKTLQILVLAVV